MPRTYMTALACLTALYVTPAAHAATVQLDGPSLRFAAAGGEFNNVIVRAWTRASPWPTTARC
ncbi:MAG: hypothetical protein H0W96_14135 [Solirubrobacterales bacterium]|nr:hypothetical protein [Solirubrobacterales bacterium]